MRSDDQTLANLLYDLIEDARNQKDEISFEFDSRELIKIYQADIRKLMHMEYAENV